MSTTDSKKVKRKKGRKPAAKISSAVGAPSLAITTTGTSEQSQSNNTVAEGADQQGVMELEKLMDEEDGVKTRLSQLPVVGKGPLPYLGGEHCLLCRCAKPASEKDSSSTKGANAEDEVLVQLPLWVCADCKKTVEEEEKKGPVLEQDLRLDAPFFSEVANGDIPPAMSSICSCEACLDRRQITAELEKETQELQQCWMELRHVVRCVYREAGTGLAEPGKESSDMPDISKMKELVHRLVTRDPHQLYQRLESQGREYVIEMKVRLLKQLTSGHKTPPQAKQFVSMLLEEYANLCAAAKTLASFLTELQQEHLKRFSLTWELHNKRLFQSIIYTDPLVQNSLTMLITQLRLGAASKESYHEDTYPNILHRYFKFDDEMSVISVVWRDCQQLLEEYNEEQAALKAKQKMLKEDWEFFRAQRKLLEQTVIPDPNMPPPIPTSSSSSTHNFEAQFTETMRHILQGTKPPAEECHCPHCNRKRCPCDECTISHMITCGIINPEVVDQLPGHAVSGAPPFQPDPSRYHINVRPPSMSSTTSSSGSSSPIIVERERLTLPFDEEEEEEDEEEDEEDIPEEIDEGSRDSDDETSEDDNNSREDGDGEDEPQVMMAAPSCPEEIPKPMERNLLERGPTEGCDCTHCAQKAKAEQQLKLDENQCQCHACLQQSGQGVTTSLPQHLPPTPRPAALHLYPHIHGASNPNTAGLGPLLHPHLYELHTPLRSSALGQQKHQLNLDLDSHEALQEHIYHAYGEWDNTYDNTRFILNAHKYGGGGSLGSELFNTPPPPLLNSNPFIDNSLAMNYGTPVDNIITSMAKVAVPTTSSVATSNVIGATSTAKHEPCLKNLQPINRTLLQHVTNVSKVSTMSSTTITTTTTNVTVTAAQGSGVKVDVPLIMSDHCLKHNPFIPTTSTVFSANNLNANFSTATSNASYPFKFTTEMLRSAAALKEEAARALGNLNQPLNTTFNLGCNHTGTQASSTNQVGSKPATTSNMNQSLLNSTPLVTPGVQPLSSGAPTVSTGHQAVTACPEPDCDHQDDVYDSIDDSCSEQSSSTSTSIQKEGKYCDCCYCEVFGHSNPPVAPTSKNYQEMRDRLRLRLKKKNEAKTDEKSGHGPDVEFVHQEEKAKTQPAPAKKEEKLSTLPIEQILKYIEGGEENCKNGEKQQMSSKAAKRARQKQRKAEEKARKHPEDAETQEVDMEDSSSQQDSLQRKKKAKQKKEPSPNTSNVPSNGSSIGTNNTPNKKNSNISNRNTPIITNGAPAQANQNLNKGKSKEGKLINCANTSNNHITPGKKRPDGMVTSQENSHTESPQGSPRAVKSKRAHDSNMDVSQQHSKKAGMDAQVSLPQQNGKHSVKSKENGPKHPVVPQHSQPQPVVNRNKGLQADTGSRKKTRNAKMDAGNQEVAESPPQVPAKQARQTKSAPALHQNNVLGVHLRQVATAKGQGVPDGVSRAAPASPEKDERQSLVNGSRSTPSILQESNKIKPEAPGSAKKKTKKKSKATDDMSSVDEIFMPKPGLDLENGDLDESERELEEFKRFCLDSTPIKRGQKLQVNMNLKDIFSKKNKSGISCA